MAVFEEWRADIHKEDRVLPQTLARKSAIVTNAGMAIGRVTAIELARRGASVLISDISDRDLAEVAEVISTKGGTVETLRVDVTEQADIERLVANAVSSFGKLDIAFNNAGVSESFGPLLDQTNEDWNLVINTNLRSTFWDMQRGLVLCSNRVLDPSSTMRASVASCVSTKCQFTPPASMP